MDNVQSSRPQELGNAQNTGVASGVPPRSPALVHRRPPFDAPPRSPTPGPLIHPPRSPTPGPLIHPPRSPAPGSLIHPPRSPTPRPLIHAPPRSPTPRPPIPPTQETDLPQSFENEERAETEPRVNEQAAVGKKLYKPVQHFVQCLLPLSGIIVGGCQVVVPHGIAAVFLAIGVLLIVLSLATSCFLKMWVIYQEVETEIPLKTWLKSAYPFYMDLTTFTLGAIWLLLTFGVAAHARQICPTFA